MNKLLSQIIINTVLKKKKPRSAGSSYNRMDLARGYREFRVLFISGFKDICLITLGIFSAALGLKGFLIPNHFIDGGATGIALLISEYANLPLPILLVIVNLPFMLLGATVINRPFSIKMAAAIIGLALVTTFFRFPDVTHDKLLVAIFGGFFLGAGIGLTVRGGSVLDGTEVLAIAVSRKSGATIGDIILIINIMVFSSAAMLLSVESALYSMITYLAATKTLDFIIEGIEEYTGITIVSKYSEEIRIMITQKLGRGVTVYKGKSGFGKKGHTSEIEIVFTVITRLEIRNIQTEIEKIDPAAFVIMNSIKDTKGGMIKKRPFKD